MRQPFLFPIAQRRLAGRFAAVLALAVLTALGACETRIERNRFAEITFVHTQPLRVDVASIDIVTSYRPPMSAPHVEHRLTVTPAEVAERWASDRLDPAGASGRLLYEVIDARVVESPLDTDDSLLGVLKVEQASRFDARVQIAASIRREDGGWARAEVQATRSTTVPEDATLNERELAIHRMIQLLADDLDAELERTFREVFASYVRS